MNEDVAARAVHKKWILWLEAIYNDLNALIITRYIYYGLLRIIQSNKEIDKKSYLYTYLHRTYNSFIVMGIRRQAKYDERSISLIRLLYDFKEKHYYIERRGKKLDLCLIEKQISLLEKKTEKCIKLADKYFAHYDKSSINKGMLIRKNEINNNLNLIAQIYMIYAKAFKTSYNGIWPPSGKHIGDNWKDVLRTPWIKD
jgi:hypothetical protein